MNKIVGILLIILLLIVACNRRENTDPLTITEISTPSIETFEKSLTAENKALSSDADTDIEPPAPVEVITILIAADLPRLGFLCMLSKRF